MACTQEYIFNKIVVMVIVYWVNREPSLNMVCCGTKFMVAHELSGRSSAEVWQDLFFEWVLRFLCPPQFLIVDAAREFVIKEFRDNCCAVGANGAHRVIGKSHGSALEVRCV